MGNFVLDYLDALGVALVDKKRDRLAGRRVNTFVVLVLDPFRKGRFEFGTEGPARAAVLAGLRLERLDPPSPPLESATQRSTVDRAIDERDEPGISQPFAMMSRRMDSCSPRLMPLRFTSGLMIVKRKSEMFLRSS